MLGSAERLLCTVLQGFYQSHQATAATVQVNNLVLVRASESSINWETLAQYAQAARAEDMLALATRCHPQTLRQLRWANTMLKNQAPQILTSL